MKTGQKALYQRLDEEKSITVQDYMDFCLYHPDYGYYQHEDGIGQGLGQGNFTTSPEISPLFGEMIALDFLNHYQQNPQIHDKNKIYLIEAGPGRGTLMLDILNTLKLMPDVLAKLQIFLMETSEILKSQQKERLINYKDKLNFVANINEIPTDEIWYFVANEFFDALPHRQILPNGRDRLIIKSNIGLKYKDEIHAKNIREEPILGKKIINEIAQSMQKTSGVGLIIDYGYQGETMGDTFQALYQGQKTAPLLHPTEADLTFHIAFDILQQSLDDYALETKIYTQADYLLSMGIEYRYESLLKTYLAQNQEEKAQKLKLGLLRLIGRQEMGQLFKVLRFIKS